MKFIIITTSPSQLKLPDNYQKKQNNILLIHATLLF